MTAKEALSAACERLEAGNIENSRFEAEQIVLSVCDISVSQLLLSNSEISPKREEKIFSLVKKRLTHYPLQYLLGEWEFYSLPFNIGEGVLIPRSDTELLVDTAVEFVGQRENLDIIDLCSGSGCVAIAVARNCAGCNVSALEKYEEAFQYLKSNIKLNDIDVTPIKADLSDEAEQMYDVVISNPPYIKRSVLNTLMDEVKHEPVTALDGGEDGLDFYRIICNVWVKKINPGGALIVEIGYDQKQQVIELFQNAGLCNVTCKKDFAGNDRVIIGTVAAKTVE